MNRKNMYAVASVSQRVFKAIEKSDIKALAVLREEEIRPILPCLVRMSLIAPLDHSEECISGRKVILRILSGIEVVNSLVALLSIDFPVLEVDVKKEQQFRQKLSGGNQSDSMLVQNLTNGLALEFECSDPTRRLRLLLSELLFVMAQIRDPRPDFYHKTSELFDNPCYLDEVSDVLCIALAELPGLLYPAEVAEALLHVTNGPALIARVVSNQPDCFREVVTGLVSNGEKQDEECQGGLIRLQAIRMLCQMNPSQALNVRTICVNQCRMPGLALYVSLDMAKSVSVSSSVGVFSGREGGDDDVVSFVTGLLLSQNQQQKAWFAQFVKNGQRRKYYEHPTSALIALRTELCDRLRNLLIFSNSNTLVECKVTQATALLRLFCALKNLANFKFSEEKDISLLLQLVTSRPPLSSAGVRFVSTGLCMLIAFPMLITSQENEHCASEWIKWLVKEESYFVGASGVSSSFGAMLLLMAIFFHGQQLSAIIDLVSSALGMKIATKASSLTRIKSIFTHDVFTEQVMTAHAAKVPVTENLNADLPGLLPVHCVYHQLKSRMFAKHRVPIKNWILKQICAATAPIHPVLPQLIEVYVNSILVPPTKGGILETFNEPISEIEILAVFTHAVFLESSSVRRRQISCSNMMLRTSNKMQDFSRRTLINKSNEFNRFQSGGSSSSIDDINSSSSVLTSQLLLLYYLLFYEDVRLNNMHSLLTVHRHPHVYSQKLFSQLPIKYLLSHAKREQRLYAGLFSSLIKLLVAHYPQLCLVEDWLYHSGNSALTVSSPKITLDEQTLTTAMEKVVVSPGHLLLLLNRLLLMPVPKAWPLAASLTGCIKCLLLDGVPRKVLDTYRLVWLRLNSLFPRRLWVMTLNGLIPDDPKGIIEHSLCEDDIILDPLNVLRCDPRVLRCAPLFHIVLYMLQVYLLSSRTSLMQHVQNHPILASSLPPTVTGPPQVVEEEREKLRSALVLTQESAAIQILLESMMQLNSDQAVGGQLALQEVRSMICCYLHQAFIADTALAKLVHFQGYPSELLAPVMRGVPSVYITQNWIQEMIQLPDLDKQMFAIELASQLSIQNALPSTLGIARLALNVLATLISMLAEKQRTNVMTTSLPSIVRIGRAFPPLMEDVTNLLVTYLWVAVSQSAVTCVPSPKTFINYREGNADILGNTMMVPWKEDHLCTKIVDAFHQLVLEVTRRSDLF